MAEEVQQDGQKTLVAFIVGLLIGGMLVWAFSGPDAATPVDDEDPNPATEEAGDEGEASTDESADDEESDTSADTNNNNTESAPAAELSVGEGDISVSNQPAGRTVQLDNATYPVSEGWIGVRDYNNDELGYIKGVVRFSESQGLVPEEIILQQPTIPGREYAVVIFTEDGDFDFSLAGDVQIDQIFDTFTAQ